MYIIDMFKQTEELLHGKDFHENFSSISLNIFAFPISTNFSYKLCVWLTEKKEKQTNQKYRKIIYESCPICM